MACPFTVGQQVVYIFNDPNGCFYVVSYTLTDGPKFGEVLTIKEINFFEKHGIMLWFYEWIDEEDDYDWIFFKSLIKTDISIFEQMLVPTQQSIINAYTKEYTNG
jgi:hypothetical protein